MTKFGRNSIARCLMATCALLLAGVSAQLDAQLPGPHPAYLHAIRDLRQARGILQYNFGKPAHIAAANAAIPQITAAIDDLKTASHLDEKSLGSVPPPKSVDQAGRFHEAEALLDSAFHDVNLPESDPVARPFKDHALDHIDHARKAVRPVL